MRHTWAFGLGIGLASLLAGCASDERTTDEDIAFNAATLKNTNLWGCRTCRFQNSPVGGPYDVGEVYLGKPGSSQVTLSEIEDPAGQRHEVVVKDGRFQAETGVATIEGLQLVGWKLIIASAGNEVPVEIMHVEPQGDWVTGAAVETYALAHTLGQQMQEIPATSLCPGVAADDSAVVLLEDDRFDLTHKKVQPNNPGFVTLACRGHALAKMRMIGHTAGDGYNSSPDDRQAAFKMLTADYCGEGQPFTTIGQPLDWVDQLGNFPPVSGGVIEARWDAGGVSCLDKPRNPAYDHQDVENACGHSIPDCSGLSTGQLWTTYLVP